MGGQTEAQYGSWGGGSNRSKDNSRKNDGEITGQTERPFRRAPTSEQEWKCSGTRVTGAYTKGEKKATSVGRSDFGEEQRRIKMNWLRGGGGLAYQINTQILGGGREQKKGQNVNLVKKALSNRRPRKKKGKKGKVWDWFRKKKA